MNFKVMTALVAMATLAACNNSAADKGAAPAAPAAAPDPATAITLQPITEADGVEFGNGCSCGFQTDTAKMLQYGAGREGGDKVAMRINGAIVRCMITPDEVTALSAGEGSFQCDGYRVTLTPKGDTVEGDDSHIRDARLTITRADQTVIIDGALGCAC